MTAVALSRPYSRRRGKASGVAGKVARAAGLALGLLVVLLGIVIAPLPGPMGAPVMAVGLVLILRASPGAKRLFIRANRRWPRVVGPLRRLLRPNPPIAQIFWQQILRMERLVTSRGHRMVARLRKGFKLWLRATFRSAPGAA